MLKGGGYSQLTEELTLNVTPSLATLCDVNFASGNATLFRIH